MSVLFTYPGQGGQRVGMLHALPDTPEVASTLREAGDVLGVDPLTLDTAQALASTTAVQLCLLIAGVAMTRALCECGAGPDLVAGMSIGAWPAAVAAGVLDFSAALPLVRLRGSLMETAYPTGFGMAAIVGMSASAVADITAQVYATGLPAFVANLNAERQIVVAGSDAALSQVMDLAQAAGATGVTRLAMAVPSHCALLDAQADVLAEAVANIPLRAPRMPYVSGARARVLFQATAIADDLARNMARPVQWHDATRHAYERGARLAVEMPTGGVLSRLAQTIFGSDGTLDGDVVPIASLAARIQRSRD